MKSMLCLILILPLFCTNKKIVETVKLNNLQYVDLYVDGTWKFKQSNKENSDFKNHLVSSNNQKFFVKQDTIQEKRNHKIYATPTCGALTKKGTPCKRKVVGGGRCWQH